MILDAINLGEISLFTILLLVFIGFVVGTVASLGGMGGGPFIMPILILIFKNDIMMAKGTTTFMILLSSGIGSYIHYKRIKIHIPSLLIISSSIILGSISCFLLQNYIQVEEMLFYIFFGLFEIAIAIKMFFSAKTMYFNHKKAKNISFNPEEILDDPYIKNETQKLIKRKAFLQTIPLFFFIGFSATFLGIGGGSYNTLIFYEMLRLPIYSASASSTFIIFINSIFNTIYYGINGDVDWIFGSIMGLGMIGGSYLGAKYIHKLPQALLMVIIGILISITGITMILKVF